MVESQLLSNPIWKMRIARSTPSEGLPHMKRSEVIFNMKNKISGRLQPMTEE
jgi:hypothetical protein